MDLDEGIRYNMETQVIALESQVFNVEIFNRMADAKDAMQAARGNIDADTVADIMDDMAEEKDIADQIAEAISQPQGDVLEDDDLLEEYRLLEEQELEAAAAQTASTTASAPTVNQTTTTPGLQMPDVPTGPINGATPEEMEQLKELQAMMM